MNDWVHWLNQNSDAVTVVAKVARLGVAAGYYGTTEAPEVMYRESLSS